MKCEADSGHGQYLKASALFRDRMSTKKVDEQMHEENLVPNRSVTTFNKVFNLEGC